MRVKAQRSTDEREPSHGVFKSSRFVRSSSLKLPNINGVSLIECNRNAHFFFGIQSLDGRMPVGETVLAFQQLEFAIIVKDVAQQEKRHFGSR